MNNNHIIIHKKRIIYSTLAFVSILAIFLCIMIPFIGKKNNSNNVDNNLVSLIQDINQNKVTEKPESYNEFVNKYNEFSAKITEETINLSQNNTISPYSIFSCLVLVSQVCDNNSKAEILNALNMTDELILENYPYFYSKHNYEVKNGFKVETKEKTYNSIWLEKGLKVKENAINNLTNNYYCYPYHINFKNSKSANDIITKYVSNNTEGLINQDFDIPADTILSLINVNYLSDIWSEEGLDQVSGYSFTNNNNEVTKRNFNKTEFIRGKIEYEDNYSHFYAYTNNYYFLSFILPNEDEDIHKLFNKDNISHVNNSGYELEDETYEYYTSCIFPSFELESDLIELNDILTNKFGIKDIFNPNKCDLSKLLYTDAYFDKVVHKAKVEVDEKGIKASAVTMAYGKESSALPDKQIKCFELILDKPFGLIVSNYNREILYTGIVDKI